MLVRAADGDRVMTLDAGRALGVSPSTGIGFSDRQDVVSRLRASVRERQRLEWA